MMIDNCWIYIYIGGYLMNMNDVVSRLLVDSWNCELEYG